MSSSYTRICAAFKYWSEQVTVFFSLRAPRGGKLVKNAIVCKSDNSKISKTKRLESIYNRMKRTNFLETGRTSGLSKNV